MEGECVAKVWWAAPHDGDLERLVWSHEVVRFGRSSEADIRIGHAPIYDKDVPRIWGELFWHRGRIHVTNVSGWGFDLVPESEESQDPAWRGRLPVPPGVCVSPPVPVFCIVAAAPGTSHEIHVRARERPRLTAADTSGEVPSIQAFSLTESQRRIGAALLEPIDLGRARRASYEEIAARSHYSIRHVRDNIRTLDWLFITHQLVEPDPGTDALDRVANALQRHRTLIAARTPV